MNSTGHAIVLGLCLGMAACCGSCAGTTPGATPHAFARPDLHSQTLQSHDDAGKLDGRARAKHLARTYLLDMAHGVRPSNRHPRTPGARGSVGEAEDESLEFAVIRNIAALFDDTPWHRTDLRCWSRLADDNTADSRFLAQIYLKEGQDGMYTALVPFWLGVDAHEGFKGVTADVIIDVLNVDYPEPADAVVIDLLTGVPENIKHRVKDGRIIFRDITVTDFPRVIRFTSPMVRGYLKGEEPKTEEDKVRTARTVRRIIQQIDSWTPLAQGQIIAQAAAVRPIVSHGGYHTHGTKRAVIWTNNRVLSGSFEIIEQLNNRQHPATQSVVYRGSLEDAGKHIWGGNNLVADFSDFRKPGLYRIRLRFAQDVKEVCDSYSFPIRPLLYLELGRKAAGFLYYQRCGTEIPGWHKACHLDDAIIMPDGRVVEATGGWHSAGDYNKWIGPAHFAVRGLTNLFEECAQQREGDRRDGLPKLLEEALWEVQFFKKVYYQGSFLSIVNRGIDPWMWSGAPELGPPRIATLEQIEKIHQRSSKPTTLFTAAAMVRTARLSAPYQKEVDRATLQIAESCHDILRETDPSHVGDRGPFGVGMGDSFLMFNAGLLLLDLELSQITHEAKYERDATKRVEVILALRGQDGLFHTDKEKTVRQPNPDLHFLALYEYMMLYPDTPFKADITDVFASWLTYTKPLHNMSPFGQVGGYRPDGGMSNIPGRSSVLARNAWILATAALLLNDTKYLDMAERQLQWIVGLNPADISMMAGVGKGPGCYHNRYCFIEGHEDGVVPGSIVNGINAGTGKLFNLGDYDTRNYVIADRLPVDYPIVDTGVYGWTYAYHTSETRNFTNGWFMLAAAQVEKAFRTLR
ncbi:MAG: glycoside hydrolase family 9 protein [Phycisphaerales bacterium]|nr:glycoside hydrolase family 9 protein [Phycisphaerales bacterium]